MGESAWSLWSAHYIYIRSLQNFEHGTTRNCKYGVSHVSYPRWQRVLLVTPLNTYYYSLAAPVRRVMPPALPLRNAPLHEHYIQMRERAPWSRSASTSVPSSPFTRLELNHTHITVHYLTHAVRPALQQKSVQKKEKNIALKGTTTYIYFFLIFCFFRLVFKFTRFFYGL